MTTTLPYIITSGEPSGIGPDLVVQLAFEGYLQGSVVVADPDLLKQRAQLCQMSVDMICLEPLQNLYYPDQKPLFLADFEKAQSHACDLPHPLIVLPVPLTAPCAAGVLDPSNANYVLRTLEIATYGVLAGYFSALVTGPVHKGIMNEAGIPFSGHTEWLAEKAGGVDVVMLLLSDNLKVALVTTHLALKDVPRYLTPSLLEKTIRILQAALIRQFGIQQPRIGVCGLNPHAGENGHLGTEEITVITPVLEKLRAEGFVLEGPLSADTAFYQARVREWDVIVALYHDQGLPVLKYASFGQGVNMTLGLPFIRTSVDHGTALTLAGTGLADVGSFKAAIDWAKKLVYCHHEHPSTHST